jgi:hypothetical protein
MASAGGSTPAGTSGAGGEGGTASAGASGSAGSGGASGGGAPEDGGSTDGGGGAVLGDAACGGPVPTTAVDMHCTIPDGGRGYSVPPHEGSEADDDDCFHHVKMTVPCIVRDQEVSFIFDIKNLGTMTPATGAAPTLDATIVNHPYPSTNPTATENNGVYTIGPVLFDRNGRWTATLHMYDAIPTKHSHVSFYVDVP